MTRSVRELTAIGWSPLTQSPPEVLRRHQGCSQPQWTTARSTSGCSSITARPALCGGVAGLERGVLVAPGVAVPLDVVAQLGQLAEDVLVEHGGAFGVVGRQVVLGGQRRQQHR